MREKRNLLSAFDAVAEVASQKERALAQGEEVSEMEGAQALAQLSETTVSNSPEPAGLAFDAQVPNPFKLVYIDPFLFIDHNWGDEEAEEKKAKIRAYIARHLGVVVVF